MSDYQVVGTIVSIGEKKVISDKFSVQSFVIETEGQYPQKVEFQAANKNIDDLAKLAAGEKVEFKFELRGREYENKEKQLAYFNSLSAYNIKATF